MTRILKLFKLYTVFKAVKEIKKKKYIYIYINIYIYYFDLSKENGLQCGNEFCIVSNV